jgi:hypothetical protein
VSKFRRPHHFTGVLIEDRQPGRFAAGVNLQAQWFYHMINDLFF